MIDWQDILDHSDCLVSREQVNQAVEAIAAKISSDYHDKNPIILCVMNGGLFFTAQLCQHLSFPLRLDYLHASRYRGKTTGSELQWLKSPHFNLANEHVLIVDDIYDEGVTLQEVAAELEKQNPASIESVVLVDKQHTRKVNDYQVKYIAMQVEDRYLFGCGMDYLGHWRHLPQIYAVKDTE